VFIENLILKKSDIEIVIIESHGISDISLVNIIKVIIKIFNDFATIFKNFSYLKNFG
jgi:hypothetical protein